MTIKYDNKVYQQVLDTIKKVQDTQINTNKLFEEQLAKLYKIKYEMLSSL